MPPATQPRSTIDPPSGGSGGEPLRELGLRGPRPDVGAPVPVDDGHPPPLDDDPVPPGTPVPSPPSLDRSDLTFLIYAVLGLGSLAVAVIVIFAFFLVNTLPGL